MAGTGSFSPLIKDEPEEHSFPVHKMFMNGIQAGNHFNNGQSGFSHGGINPNNLMTGVPPGNGAFNFYPTQAYNRSTNGSGILDEELLEGLPQHVQDTHNNQGQHGNYNDLSLGAFDLDLAGHSGMAGMTIDHHSHLNNGFSSTPDGNPMASPFARSFTAEQFRQIVHQQPQQQQQQQQFGSTSMPYSSPHMGSDMGSDMFSGANMEDPYRINKQSRPPLGSMDRRTTGPRSPMTPKTGSLNARDLNINTSSQPSSYPSQPIRATSQAHRHQKSLSTQDWGEASGSMGGSIGSPLSSFTSPLQHSMHPQISSILQTGQHASLPAKVSNGHHTSNTPQIQTQEMKRRRRRESHNLVERRRRDNINERIQELSHLVPQHRLEDEKVKKHLQNNNPISPTLGNAGISPPQATSGLAGPGARRATAGNITTGIPVEEKDKGPNKGDILNGAVSWTRDLMWMLNLKMHQQQELEAMIENLGGRFPFTKTEDEARMESELMDAINKNEVGNFSYSRTPGTGLRVPRHTDIKGEPLASDSGGAANDNSLSPEDHSTGGELGQGGLGMGGAGQYWSGHNSGGSGPGSIGGFKEEDEYQMDMTQ